MVWIKLADKVITFPLLHENTTHWNIGLNTIHFNIINQCNLYKLREKSTKEKYE